LSQLEGYTLDFEPIEIGKSVSLSWRVFVLPGAKIGDGAVIGANSLVNRTIPPRCLAIGYPARVVSKFPDFPKDLSNEEKAALFENMIREMLLFFQGSGLLCEGPGPDYRVSRAKKDGRKGGKGWRLRVGNGSPAEKPATPSSDDIDVFLSFDKISAEDRSGLDARRVTWFDVENKETSHETNDLVEEVALFLGRYGLRFFRVRD
jgi:hypothetical protein